jgi:putative ABC transport system permease protein
MEAFLKDVKHSLRMFLRSPSFTLTAITALALGIGATTAIFTLVNSILLKPVPFAEPDRLVMLMSVFPNGAGPAASPAKFAHWRAQSMVLEEVAAFRNGVLNLTGGDLPEQLRSSQVSADYFRCFRAPVILGRSFTAEEDRPNGPRVAMIGEQLWTRRFGRDPDLLGKTISLSGDPHVVVGIVGAGFDLREFGLPPEVWVPFQLDPNSTDQGHYFNVAGRLKPGVTIEQARARLEASAHDYRRKFPNFNQRSGFGVERYADAVVRNSRESLHVLAGAVSFVLLIACANVANLLLVRATARKREIAVRAAIGAGRGRIVRQLLTESVLLSLAGGALGTLLGIAGIRGLLSVNTAGLPRVGMDGSVVSVDWRVLAFAIAVSAGAGILFGLFPALQSSRADLSANLKESSGRSGSGFRQNKARSVLVVSEVALALVLLIGSALLIRTSLALAAVDPGFNPKNVLTMRMSLTGNRFLTAMGVEQMVRDSVERVRSVPGVAAASATCCVPLQGGYGLPFIIAGRPLDGPSHGDGGWATVSAGYFEVFQIPVKRGRAFTNRDDRSGPPGVIINEAMAKKFWPKGDPLNDRLIIGRGVMREFQDEPPRQIIGVVGDIRDGGLNNDPGPKVYVPQGQVGDLANALNLRISPMAWVVRTRVPPLSLSAAIQERLRQSTGLPVSEVSTMEDVVSRSVSRQRFNMLLMSVFGGAALLLAAIGIYGLIAYSVEQRKQEIGIRLALGAGAAQVRNMVVLQGMRLALAGVALGLAAAFGLTRLMAAFLYGVQPVDAAVFTAAPITLAAVALAAVWFPARRASRVDPMIALRCE